MLVNQAVPLVLAAAVLWEARSDAAPSAYKICGRKLGEIMARVCHVYNSPTWDLPTVVEQPGPARRRRQAGGIADECCSYGCTWEQLSEYCSVSANSESLLGGLDTHLIADRSAEQESNVASATGSASVAAPSVLGRAQRVLAGDTRQASDARREADGTRREADGSRREADGLRRESDDLRREVGAAVGGYGRARRGRRCRCRRKRRSGRRRASLMGNMELVRNVPRAAPVVGTVSPLLTWGRTLNTDLPQVDRDRYAYVAVYST